MVDGYISRLTTLAHNKENPEKLLYKHNTMNSAKLAEKWQIKIIGIILV